MARIRTYVADVEFRFALQSGNWPACEADLTELHAGLQAALMRDGFTFSYVDPFGWDVEAQVLAVTAPVPCGDMEPTSLVHGMLMWQATSPPRPGQGWEPGISLAGWLNAVPWVGEGLSVMVGVASISIAETMTNDGGLMWPPPDGWSPDE